MSERLTQTEESGPEHKARILGKLRDLSLRAPDEIEKDIRTTENTWLVAYANRLNTIRITAERFLPDFATAPEYDEARNKLESLTALRKQLVQKYPTRETELPPEVKEQLLEAFELFKK